ncbi:hypothetical protein [Rhizobium phaseoli]|uniref:hypothetical protein n=1 Tax=Rhizobium phaseoli TaxID=396 RepID=UPI0007EA31DF|nr:hypothetical protein [Rhizobium phaseoli]ANL37940.1 hypothetical protein AMC89_PD00482 [Rhizobium phaseoli]ANL50610.1 hypothetical protein AMC87_PD00486 [Rhizobium phaseoli]ANM01649.1 hypothetical protein AMC79_PD00481 [Rhizobium phaseoli]
MLDLIIRSAFNIVGRAERLIEAARRLLDGDERDELEVYELDCEIERLRDVVFGMDEAVRSLALTVEYWPRAVHAHALPKTLH